MNEQSCILVAGHTGLVGSALIRCLKKNGFRQLLTVDQNSVDLTRQADTERFFAAEQPEYVFLAAAKVGGIFANDTQPADFIRDNLLIQTNVIDAARAHGVRKLLFLGSSCIYPRHADQPMTEDALLTGPLEPTNQWYAVAKIAGIKLVQAFRRQHGFCGVAVMPTNLYGPGDNFDLETSHVLPALIRRFHDAKVQSQNEVVLWGTGAPRREFLFVDDLADALLFVMRHYDEEAILNIGVGEDVTIAELATLVARIVGFTGAIRFDPHKPDGTPRKLLDVSRLTALGWQAQTALADGVSRTYAWYQQHHG